MIKVRFFSVPTFCAGKVRYSKSLKADEVLQKRLHEIENIEVRTNVQLTRIIGDGTRVRAFEIEDRASSLKEQVEIDGIFIQVGLTANSSLFADIITLNSLGEIEVDRNGRTSRLGLYAAGDVTDVTYKQIIIAMGEGAKAALAAYDDLIKGVVGAL